MAKLAILSGILEPKAVAPTSASAPGPIAANAWPTACRLRVLAAGADGRDGTEVISGGPRLGTREAACARAPLVLADVAKRYAEQKHDWSEPLAGTSLWLGRNHMGLVWNAFNT